MRKSCQVVFPRLVEMDADKEPVAIRSRGSKTSLDVWGNKLCRRGGSDECSSCRVCSPMDAESQQRIEVYKTRLDDHRSDGRGGRQRRHEGRDTH